MLKEVDLGQSLLFLECDSDCSTLRIEELQWCRYSDQFLVFKCRPFLNEGVMAQPCVAALVYK